MTQKFNSKQEHYIANGITKQLLLRSKIAESFNNNPFSENYIISSLPGMGKTYEAKQQTTNNDVVWIEGSSTMAFFTIQIATAVYLADGEPLVIVLDDCDVIFEAANANTAKKMFDDTKRLKYNKMRKGLKAMCSDISWEAIESFSTPESPGFAVPLDNVTFIVLSNRLLPTSNQVDSLQQGSKKHTTATDLLAIRRRTNAETIDMELFDLWGYVANVTLNEQICQKFYPTISSDEQHQLVNWLYHNWESVTERNLSIVEKMTKDMVRFPDKYLDIWEANYVEVV